MEVLPTNHLWPTFQYSPVECQCNRFIALWLSSTQLFLGRAAPLEDDHMRMKYTTPLTGRAHKQEMHVNRSSCYCTYYGDKTRQAPFLRHPGPKEVGVLVIYQWRPEVCKMQPKPNRIRISNWKDCFEFSWWFLNLLRHFLTILLKQ